MEDEETTTAADQAHGKLLETSDGHKLSSNQADDKGFATVDSTTKSISPAQDFKIDIHDPQSTDSTISRCSSRRVKRCLLVLLLVIIIVVACGFLAFIVYRRYANMSQSICTQTAVGQIRGRLVTIAAAGGVDYADVAEYLGIPFALPPVGDLRYADPVPLDRLPKDPFNADAYGPSCMQQSDTSQGDFVGTEMWNPKQPHSEDCLYLNVWVPRSTSTKTCGSEKSSNSDSKRAVMVWIYGGAFNSGSSSLWLYDGKALAAFGDVIVVSLNYRVGSFGFLSTGDGRVKGNFGLKDQATALRWVNKNIASFGGDPSLVTLFGESSGASSVGMHQLSTGSAHLFTRVIFQSGSPSAHWSFVTQGEARRRSKMLFDAVNCSDTQFEQTAGELLSCLRRLDSQTILRNDWVTKQFMAFPWAPTVDGEFLVDTPSNLLQSGRFHRKDALLGANRDEGSYWILPELPGFSRHNSSLQDLTMFRHGVDVITWDLGVNQRRAVLERYEESLRSGDDLAANRDALDRVCGDRFFTCPTSDLADVYSLVGQKIFFYYLTHRATNEQWPPWMGVIHGAEIQWIFGMPMNKSRGYSEDEVEFSKVMMTYWTNFAKTGTPNGRGVIEWPEYSADNRRYLELRGPNDYVVIDTFRETYCQVWRDINRQIQLQHQTDATSDEQTESLIRFRRRRRHHRLIDFTLDAAHGEFPSHSLAHQSVSHVRQSSVVGHVTGVDT